MSSGWPRFKGFQSAEWDIEGAVHFMKFHSSITLELVDGMLSNYHVLSPFTIAFLQYCRNQINQTWIGKIFTFPIFVIIITPYALPL